MDIDFDELEAVCKHNTLSGNCDRLIELEAVDAMDSDVPVVHNVECSEEACPLKNSHLVGSHD